jgi:succinate dehydrogenase/fumarate reductase flavoprotein subunit
MPGAPTTRDYIQKNYGVDIAEQPIEVACIGHAINGGLRIEPNAETTVACLYAGGETAGGPHGADRLGGNMNLTCQVFGRRAGCSAAQRARERGIPSVSTALIAAERERLADPRSRRGNVDSLLTVAEIMARAALLRTESRGSHYREDYTQRDDANWEKSIVTRRVKGRMEQYTRRLPRLAEAVTGQSESTGKCSPG